MVHVKKVIVAQSMDGAEKVTITVKRVKDVNLNLVNVKLVRIIITIDLN